MAKKQAELKASDLVTVTVDRAWLYRGKTYGVNGKRLSVKVPKGLYDSIKARGEFVKLHGGGSVDDVEVLQNDNSELQKKVETLTKQNEALSQQVETLTKERNDARQSLSVANADIAELQKSMMDEGEPKPGSEPGGDNDAETTEAAEGSDDTGEGDSADDSANKADQAEGEGDLPDDFPHVEILRDNGVTTFEEIRALKGGEQVKGIGPAKWDDIQAALK